MLQIDERIRAFDREIDAIFTQRKRSAASFEACPGSASWLTRCVASRPYIDSSSLSCVSGRHLHLPLQVSSHRTGPVSNSASRRFVRSAFATGIAYPAPPSRQSRKTLTPGDPTFGLSANRCELRPFLEEARDSLNIRPR
jgi:hypothetical protein